jgi:hypothetical protein
MRALSKAQNDAGVSIRSKSGVVYVNFIRAYTKLIGTKETLIISR